MNKLLYLLTILSICFCVSCSREVPINERPMYGGVPPTPHVQKVHDELIEDAVKEFGSREAGAEEVLELAWDYYYKGDYKAAMRRFNQVWLLNPNNAEAFFGFGRLMDKKDNFDEAIKMYTKAIQINPRYEDAYNNRGLGYADKGDYKQAISDFTKAIQIDPNDSQTYHDRASCYVQLKEYEKALLDFTKALEIDPKATRSYNDRAVIYFRLKDYDKSWEDVHKAKQLGYKHHPRFLKKLKEASGRDE